MKASMEIVLRSDGSVLESIYRSLLPESLNPPSIECRVSLEYSLEELIVKIECDRINLLRAVANSYLGLISSIIRSVEEIGYESTKTTTRSSTSNY